VGQVDNLRADLQSAQPRAQDAIPMSLVIEIFMEFLDSHGLGKSVETARKSACATY
jgi:hypothetical protein